MFVTGYRIFLMGPVEAAVMHGPHHVFFAWGLLSSDPIEAKAAASLLTRARARCRTLSVNGHPRWPNIGPLTNNKRKENSNAE